MWGAIGGALLLFLTLAVVGRYYFWHDHLDDDRIAIRPEWRTPSA